LVPATSPIAVAAAAPVQARRAIRVRWLLLRSAIAPMTGSTTADSKVVAVIA
jgi:hypothetical protein